MMHNKAHEIKRQQKKSLYLRTITQLIQPLIHEEHAVAPIYPSRVELSKDTGICYIYFSSVEAGDGKEAVEAAIKSLILYKPSLRTALAKAIQSRRAPDLVFLFDDKEEKSRRINELLDKVRGILDSEE